MDATEEEHADTDANNTDLDTFTSLAAATAGVIEKLRKAAGRRATTQPSLGRKQEEIPPTSRRQSLREPDDALAGE